MVLVVLACAVRAQDPLAEFGHLFTEAVRRANAAQQVADLRAARGLLDDAERRIDELPADRRGQAAFFVGVRRVEMLARVVELHARSGHRGPPLAPDGDQALRDEIRDRALAVRKAALAVGDERGRPVYGGYYRVLLLVHLWNVLGDGAFFGFVEREGEREFLFADATEAAVEKGSAELYAPLHLMRCGLLMRDGQAFEARRQLEELALAVEARPGTPSAWRDKCYAELAGFFLARHDYDRAEVYLRHVDPQRALYPRALIALRRGDYPTAEKLGRQLVQREPVHYLLLGEALELSGRPEQALQAYLKGRQAVTTPEDRALAENHIGDCHLLAGRLDAAALSYRRALELLPEAKAKLLQGRRAEMLKDLGRLEEQRCHADRARDWYRQALAAIEAARRDIPVDVLGSSWLRGNFLVPTIDGLLRTEPDAWRALAAVDSAKARGLLDWMREPPVENAAVSELRERVRQLALTADAGQLGARLEALERARALSERAGLRSASGLTAEQLRRMADAVPRTALLSYWLGEREAWLLAALPGGRLERLRLGGRDSLLALVRAAYQAVASPRGDPWPALDAAAAGLLPAALQRELAAVERIVVCPDALLSRLPFEALRLDGRPLGTTHDVVWAPSLAVLGELRRRDRPGQAVVVVDSVEAPAEVTHHLHTDPLLFSRAEGDAVAAAYAASPGGVVRLRGGAATLAGLRDVLKAAPVDVLHVNAHAVASPVVPSESLLLLASGPESVASLASLPLANAVVVLSACSTATGEERGGEGVVGLLWGPMAAGARAVVASLWPVNQESTAELMRRFHAWRAAGRGEADALRRARAELARSGRFGHPYYWAGFVAYGSRPSNRVLGPEPGPEWPWWSWLVAVAAGVAAAAGLWVRRRGG